MPSSLYDINRRHTLNARYFEAVDTPEKAYWLGFIWADGNISKTAPRCSGPNRMRLSQKDKGHLQLFLDTIGASYTIQTYPASFGGTCSHVDINSRPLCKSLEKLGYGLKNQRTKIPAMPADLRRHFIRGYFDGDGCLSVYSQPVGDAHVRRQEWSLTGNPEFIRNIRRVLEAETTVSTRVVEKTYARTTASISLRYGKKADIEALFHYLYDRATVFLPSKYAKFQEHFAR